MKNLFSLFLLMVFFSLYVHSVQGQKDPKEPPIIDFRGFHDVIVPVLDIMTSPTWNTQVCPENPDIDWNNKYDGAFSDKDVNKLRTIPYSNNDASGNPFISNHTFWFAFGCCGQEFCTDDLDETYVYTDDFWDVGSLKLSDVYIYSETSIWVDFLTQCEDCAGFGSAGYGVWHKWENDFIAGELLGWNNYPNGSLGARLAFMKTVVCDGFSVYGCQSGELN